MDRSTTVKSVVETPRLARPGGLVGVRLPLAVWLACVVLLLVFLSLGVGPVVLSPTTVMRTLLGDADETLRLVVLEIRVPRTVLAVAIGGILGLSGAALQGLLRNPVASPSLFGAPQAAAFGAVLAIATGLADLHPAAIALAAIACALVSVVVLLAIAGRDAGLLHLILAGLALSSLAAAGTALVTGLGTHAFKTLEMTFWLLGSLQDRSVGHVGVALPFILAGSVMLLAQRHALRVLALGEEAAASLGVDLLRLRVLVITGIALGVGGAVAVAGPIGFIGLVAPHLARLLFGPDPGRLLLPSAAVGMSLLLAADVVVRLIPSYSDVRVGVFTAILGVPFFLYLIVRERRRLGGSPG